MKHRRCAGLAVALLLAATGAGGQEAGQAPTVKTVRLPQLFRSPIACTVGPYGPCFVQNYVDRDPGPAWRDAGCGPLSYNGHTGSDFAVADLAMMQDGVAALAAADGVVRAGRDGVDDKLMPRGGRATVEGVETGNFVIVEHGLGWSTLYGHLRKGSIMVARGQKVQAGQPLGLLGISGATEFPHVHFQVQHERVAVDPFRPGNLACAGRRAAAPGPSLWAPDSGIAYVATGLVAAGFALEAPQAGRIMSGAYFRQEIPPDAPAIIFWAQLYGARKGDELALSLKGPQWTQPIASASRLPADSIRGKPLFIGDRIRSDERLAPGTYTGQLVLRRSGTIVLAVARTVTVR